MPDMLPSASEEEASCTISQVDEQMGFLLRRVRKSSINSPREAGSA